MRRSRLVVGGAVVLLLGLLLVAFAARGSGTSSLSSARAVAEALGCTDYSPGPPAPVLGVSLEGPPRRHLQLGSCTLQGARIDIAWTGRSDPGSVLFAGLPGDDSPRQFVHGVGWTVRCATLAACVAVQRRLGGTSG